MTDDRSTGDLTCDLAVIGLACRFPGADDARQFWENLRSGTESITFLSDDDLRESGADPHLWQRPGYVRAAPVLDEVERFDARFFGYSPREACLMDPQQRLFLECAWAAVEDAGYDPSRYDGPIGVYAGSAMNTYLLFSGASSRLPEDYLLTVIASDKDFLTTRVSYKLGLTGPSVAVQTACSTSLVAVHFAGQSLLSGECDMALAGGVSVRVPHRAGYLHDPGGVLSPDGHCRTFDAQAAGTLFGSGVGVVVVKRLADAVAAGDAVRAVIKGSAVNNDGSAKVDYAAPSVSSQSEVIVEALANAGVDADTISYVEAHGTGTALGDPVEVAALTKAFRTTTRRSGFCALGSVKTNVGHLDAAAGIAGLIKTVLALEHGQIPATLHFEHPNPEIDFPSTPFHVNAALSEWRSGARARRAGVSSLGIGGTNAHVVVEEAPQPAASGPSRPFQLLVLSAKTPTALATATSNLRHLLEQHPGTNLADVAHTLQVGRKAFEHRRMLVCRDPVEATTALDQLPPTRVLTSRASPRTRPVVFMFPGGGSQYPRMGRDLYDAEAVFRERVERGLEELRTRVGLDLRRLLFADRDPGETTSAELRRPSVQLPAIFLVEDALARLWMSWGVRPSAIIGFSMGEITAACLAGVFTFEDALGLVAARGHLVESASGGEMLSVRLSEERIAALLPEGLDVASVNTPDACVVSGPREAIDGLARQLAARGVEVAGVPIATAAHSRLLDPILHRFEAHVRGLELAAPSIPFISNRTGTWITAEQAVDPAYWAQQLRSTVRFADGVRELLGHPDRLFLEVGPAQTLSTFVRLHPDRTAEQLAVASLPRPVDSRSDVLSLLNALGRLWLAGAEIDWAGFAVHERRHRVPLPTYPFEGQRHWAQASAPARPQPSAAARDPGVSAQPARAPAAAPERQPVAQAAGGRAAAHVRPRTSVEWEVAAIWQDVLGIPEIGIDDDFFDLGGTSILVTEAVGRLNKTCGVELSLLTLFESPTVAGMAQCVEAVRRPRQPNDPERRS